MKCRRREAEGPQSPEHCVGETDRPGERDGPGSRVLGSGDMEDSARVHGAGEHQEELKVVP